MICEQCGREHDGSYGSGRFCSESCKQVFVSRSSVKIHKCRFCGKEFQKSTSLGAHTVNCKLNPNSKKTRQKIHNSAVKAYDKRNPVMHFDITCLNCGRHYGLDIRQKQFDDGDYRHCCSSKCAHQYAAKHVDPENVKKSIYKLNQTNHIIHCKKCGKEVLVSGCTTNIICNDCLKEKQLFGICVICGKLCDRHQKTCCAEHAKRLRIKTFKETITRTHSVGGLRNKGGRGQRGYYKGIHCDSSWELAWVIYSLDNNIEFKRNKKYFKYIYNDKEYKYYPDFILSDGTYVEIKGWNSDKWQAKLEQFPINEKLKVFYKDDLKHIFEYVKNKYGKDFIKMYDAV